MSNYSAYSKEFILNELFSDCDFCKPKLPGVYIVCGRACDENYQTIGKEVIFYVGSSHCIASRILSKDHPYMRLYYGLDGYNIYTRSYVTDDYVELEKAAIKKLNPLMNIQRPNFSAHHKNPAYHHA